MRQLARLLWLSVLLGGCLSPQPAAPQAAVPPHARTAQPAGAAATLRGLHYELTLDDARSKLAVQLCFEGKPPSELVYGAEQSLAFLRAPRALRAAAADEALAVVKQRIVLGDRAADSCIAYQIDLQAALDHDALLLVYPGEGSLLVGTELFLFRPARRVGLHATARFRLPEGTTVSTPWPEHAGSYELDERAFAFTGHVVFGHFARETIAVPGAALDSVVLDGFPAAAHDAIATWLTTAASAVSLLGGAFPLPRAQVIVVPTSPSRWPIHFGHTGRSGGASIVLFLPTDIDPAQLRDDWIAIHEFSHLLHPFVERDDAWLSEGLATYLQEVLRVRAGLLAPELAWKRLYDGAALGRETTAGLAEETRRMHHAGNYQRVYWAGAAIALMADVELRRQTAGKLSLDAALARLAPRLPQFTAGLSARELLSLLDELTASHVFMTTASPYLGATPLPDLSALYRQLGLPDGSGAVQPGREAPLSWVRDAIMDRAVLAQTTGSPG